MDLDFELQIKPEFKFNSNLYQFYITLGTSVHSSTGESLGSSLVWNLQVFIGLRSQDSSGTSAKVATLNTKCSYSSVYSLLVA